MCHLTKIICVMGNESNILLYYQSRKRYALVIKIFSGTTPVLARETVICLIILKCSKKFYLVKDFVSLFSTFLNAFSFLFFYCDAFTSSVVNADNNFFISTIRSLNIFLRIFSSEMIFSIILFHTTTKQKKLVKTVSFAKIAIYSSWW